MCRLARHAFTLCSALSLLLLVGTVAAWALGPMIFAGPGTFWTDLTSFKQIGASQMIKQQARPKK